ncbi:hypothetical protein CNEO4_60020 [Clostridium neonatale]|uniref:Uncharacterized protein n=1 Tax=Clostridium neonatale TaxID=137838 RepID=A0AA86JH30_9CLOT|nr:hypothetical protein CNEO_40401 [Clostridium neonatale]CAG9716585.1 hypothetical protein CNEO_40023 [Clostridium neonatale]CAI3192590.1 hypothetical protein CNEO2_120071 [Clostridium neonatale]CAI3195161.1 hypothetical protein CNEO2_120071 [Clostridium neonatale]CAI3198696.1 hypothetical protein CNEO2_200056 [Clostridium neonatale]
MNQFSTIIKKFDLYSGLPNPYKIIWTSTQRRFFYGKFFWMEG